MVSSMPITVLLKSFLVPIDFCANITRQGCSTCCGILTGIAIGSLLMACTDPRASVPGSSVTGEKPDIIDPSSQTTASGDIVQLSGVRISEGNAVECPQIRDDGGKLHSVSYLSPAVAIGERVNVSGFYGVSTGCVGTVLIVQTETKAEN